jgi:hypothetical protein
MSRRELIQAIEEQIGCALIRAGLTVDEADNEVQEFSARLKLTETPILREMHETGCVREAAIMAGGACYAP